MYGSTKTFISWSRGTANQLLGKPLLQLPIRVYHLRSAYITYTQLILNERSESCYFYSQKRLYKSPWPPLSFVHVNKMLSYVAPSRTSQLLLPERLAQSEFILTRSVPNSNNTYKKVMSNKFWDCKMNIVHIPPKLSPVLYRHFSIVRKLLALTFFDLPVFYKRLYIFW